MTGKFWIENDTPQGSIISTLFSLMITDVYADTVNKTGVSLFADDGAVWKVWNVTSVE